MCEWLLCKYSSGWPLELSHLGEACPVGDLRGPHGTRPIHGALPPWPVKVLTPFKSRSVSFVTASRTPSSPLYRHECQNRRPCNGFPRSKASFFPRSEGVGQVASLSASVADGRQPAPAGRHSAQTTRLWPAGRPGPSPASRSLCGGTKRYSGSTRCRRPAVIVQARHSASLRNTKSHHRIDRPVTAMGLDPGDLRANPRHRLPSPIPGAGKTHNRGLGQEVRALIGVSRDRRHSKGSNGGRREGRRLQGRDSAGSPVASRGFACPRPSTRQSFPSVYGAVL